MGSTRQPQVRDAALGSWALIQGPWRQGRQAAWQLSLAAPARAANVERTRELLGGELAALVGESYERAYGDMVRVQQLTELEEILAVRAREAVAAADGEHGSSSRLFWLPPPHQEVRPSRDPAGVFEPAEP